MAMPIWLTRQRLLALLATVSFLYVMLLLANVYQSQAQLRSAAEMRLLADKRQTAAVLGDVLEEQKNDALNIAESHEIETFLINQALGMSMRYGLNANLYSIEERLRRKLEQRTMFGAPVYQRILYLDVQNAWLVDTTPGPPVVVPPLDGKVGPQLVIDAEHGQIVTAVRVNYHGKPGGVILTVANLALLTRYLTTPSGELGFREFLLTENGRELAVTDQPLLGGAASSLARLPANVLTPLNALPGIDASAFSKDYQLVLRTAVPGTSLSLVTVLPKSVIYGHISSRLFLYFIGTVPVIFLLAALWVGHIRRRTRRLEADVIESNRNRAELQDRNDALTTEIAHREALEKELRESEERYRTYIEHAPEGIFVADASGRFVDANPSACVMVGYSRDELLGMTITSLSPPGQLEAHAAIFAGVRRDETLEVEIVLRKKCGTDMVATLRAIALPGDLIMGFCVDITERKEAEEQIHQLAYFDPLTGLPNRRLLLDRLRQAIVGSSRNREYGALLMLDLDHFKDLNDTQGHDIGDRLLTEVANRLVASVRQEDTVSRLGGDEYVAVAEGLGMDESAAALQAELIAEKVHQALGQPYVLTEGRPAYHSTSSIGVALFHGQDVALDVLLKQADVALYQAKNAGRNSIRFFNPDMQAAIDARALMEAALRRGIQQNELQLYYQIQVDWQGNVTGVEALLRWLPHDAEPVQPARFIPLAEETGLIHPIGAWVLAQACAQLQRWQANASTRNLTIAINVSGYQFHQPDFVAQVFEQIAHFNIDPTRLKLELTESVVLDRVDEVVERMQTLKNRGVSFSLDDFGTGYSSLAYLKRLPLDQIKIDQSFVRDISHDLNDAAIVRAVLAMSFSLGLNVIAEGVETEAQRAYLLRYGCEYYQGYLFGKPMPIEGIEHLLASRDLSPTPPLLAQPTAN